MGARVRQRVEERVLCRDLIADSDDRRRRAQSDDRLYCGHYRSAYSRKYHELELVMTMWEGHDKPRCGLSIRHRYAIIISW